MQQIKTSSFFVRVIVPQEDKVRFSTDDILAQAAEMVKNDAVASTSASREPRDYCPWLRNVRWQDLTQGKEVGKLIELVANPKPDEFPGLDDGLLSILKEASDLFDSTPELILQGLNTSKSTDECVL